MSKQVFMVANYHQAVHFFPEKAINLFMLKSMPKSASLLASSPYLEPVNMCKQAVSKIQVFWMLELWNIGILEYYGISAGSFTLT